MINNIIAKGDVVKFVLWNGKISWNLEGVVAGIDRCFDSQGIITNIEYCILGQHYLDTTKQCYYKHIEQKYILEVLKRGME